MPNKKPMTVEEILNSGGDLTYANADQMAGLTDYVMANAQKYPALAKGLMKALMRREQQVKQGIRRPRPLSGVEGGSFEDGKWKLRTELK